MIEGVDYAFSNPDPRGLYAAGKRFAMRYVGPGSDDKHLHADERDHIWAAGLEIVLLAEGTEDGALGGFDTGVLHARSALTAARALGAPDSLPIYFAVDFDATAAQWPAVASYLRGAGAVIGLSRVGVYGGIRSMQWAARDHVATWFFQTFAWSGWTDPDGIWRIHWYGGNHVEQYQNGVALAGGTVDLCRAITFQYGQWSKAGGGGDMTPEEHQKLFAVADLMDAMFNMRDEIATGDYAGAPSPIVAAIKDLQAKVDALGGTTPPPPIIPGAVDLTAEAVHEVAEATAQELHDRLAG